MQNPQNLQHAVGVIAVGAVNVVMITLPALGATLRYRVWRWSISVFAVPVAAATYHAYLATPAGNVLDGQTWHSTTGSGEHHFPGGFIRPANEGVQIIGVATVGGNFYVATLSYTIERV